MRLVTTIFAALVLSATAVTGVGAFQEQRQGAPVAQPAQPQPEFSSPGSSEPKSSAGTPVLIPGLGKLGNLPRMDFGLELLYGAAEGKQPVAPVQREDTTREDDLTIRGTVKHRF